ncbi:hypothetical protein BaRGS_00010369 [Batillaria attramentaria]|uniref:Methyltransferase domain-containing protein n=1 Tax=Batillaria attramentaria TaxID=370345 RepID=A0ABD0LGC5_9CAEN
MSDSTKNTAVELEPPSKAEYGQISGDVVTYGSLGLALAMAKETGIVDVLFEADTPLTSSGIAQKAGLKERYVREVLDTLTSARMLQLAPGTGGEDGEEARYKLLPQHRDEFKKTAILTRMFSHSGRFFEQIKQCFQPDTPSCVRYNDATFDMMDEMKADETESRVQVLLKTPGLRQRLEKGIQMAEVGCGQARLSLAMAAMFPNSHFALTDVNAESLDRVRTAAQTKGLSNVTCEIVDVCKPPADWNARFDWLLACDVIHDLPHPQAALDGIFRSLRQGGHFSLSDYFASSYVAKNVGNPEATVLYAMDIFFCIPESYQQPDSEALGACWGKERILKMMEKAGFQVVGIARGEGWGTEGVMMCQKAA